PCMYGRARRGAADGAMSRPKWVKIVFLTCPSAAKALSGMTRRLFLGSILALSAATATCDGSSVVLDTGSTTSGTSSVTSTGSGGGTTSHLCIPGAQVSCACPGATAGVQVCASDGDHLLPCQCQGGSG